MTKLSTYLTINTTTTTTTRQCKLRATTAVPTKLSSLSLVTFETLFWGRDLPLQRTHAPAACKLRPTIFRRTAKVFCQYSMHVQTHTHTHTPTECQSERMIARVDRMIWCDKCGLWLATCYCALKFDPMLARARAVVSQKLDVSSFQILCSLSRARTNSKQIIAPTC